MAFSPMTRMTTTREESKVLINNFFSEEMNQILGDQAALAANQVQKNSIQEQIALSQGDQNEVPVQ